MPTSPHIKIHTADLKALIEKLEAKRIGAMNITIIDNGDNYAIRDSNDFLITYLTKSPVPENLSG